MYSLARTFSRRSLYTLHVHNDAFQSLGSGIRFVYFCSIVRDSWCILHIPVRSFYPCRPCARCRRGCLRFTVPQTAAAYHVS